MRTRVRMMKLYTEAYTTYGQARSQLRDQQRRRGFFFKATGRLTIEERQAAITKQKQTTRCAACGQVGHWAGDDGCPEKDQSKPMGNIAKSVASRGRIAMKSTG